MKNKESPRSTSDEDAEALAAASREESTEMIRNHLDAHLALNPNSSYVSWIATLHPENAHVTIDPRFFQPENPWKTVYEEGQSTLHVTGIPVGHDEEDERPGDIASTSETQACHGNKKAPRNCGGLLVCVFGFSTCLTAILVAFTLESTSAFLYLLAVGCHKICQQCSKPNVNVLTILPFGIFWLLFQVFLHTDTPLLLVNVVIVEVLAGLNGILCTTFSLDYEVGKLWHQHTRRLSHHTRWAFRVPFIDWNPPRPNWYPRRVQDENSQDITMNVSDTGAKENQIFPVTPSAPTEDPDDNVIFIHQDDIVVVGASQEK